MRGVVKAKPGRAPGVRSSFWFGLISAVIGVWMIDRSRSPEDIGGRAGMYSEGTREAIFLFGGIVLLLVAAVYAYLWLCVRGTLARAYVRRTRSGVKVGGAGRLLCGGGLHVATGSHLDIAAQPLFSFGQAALTQQYRWIFESRGGAWSRRVWFNLEQADLDLLTNTLRELADVEVRFLGSSPPGPGE